MMVDGVQRVLGSWAGKGLHVGAGGALAGGSAGEVIRIIVPGAGSSRGFIKESLALLLNVSSADGSGSDGSSDGGNSAGGASKNPLDEVLLYHTADTKLVVDKLHTVEWRPVAGTAC
jgi:hypothetical protein